MLLLTYRGLTENYFLFYTPSKIPNADAEGMGAKPHYNYQLKG